MPKRRQSVWTMNVGCWCCSPHLNSQHSEQCVPFAFYCYRFFSCIEHTMNNRACLTLFVVGYFFVVCISIVSGWVLFGFIAFDGIWIDVGDTNDLIEISKYVPSHCSANRRVHRFNHWSILSSLFSMQYELDLMVPRQWWDWHRVSKKRFSLLWK